MSVRAKFKVDGVERSLTAIDRGNKDENGRAIYEHAELQTIVLSPVYGNGDPDHENSKFWQYSPAGQIRLGTINESAARYFELGEEYYVDFEKAVA
jgi:hypothetical protein